ncbi:MAG: ABC transporter permease [Verrucomicrobiota bacterium JB024]|nr:ABC transporter permease [Verrucomicrobiota bacterium JB024]
MKRTSTLSNLTSVFIFIFLYLPMLSVVMFSFNASDMGLKWGGFSLKWYQQLVHNELILWAAWNTLVLAVVSTAFSTLIGTMLAIGLYRFPWKKRTAGKLNVLLHLPVVTPDIIFAVALVIAFSVIRYTTGLFELGLTTMIVGHITFQIAFVALAVRGRLELIGHDVEEAACDLYAGYWRVLTRVLLPMLKPGIIAGAMLAFTLSLDDFVISFFTCGPKSTTLPLFIYASVKRGITPEIHALSTIVMLVTIASVALMQKLSPNTKH